MNWHISNWYIIILIIKMSKLKDKLQSDSMTCVELYLLYIPGLFTSLNT